MTEGMAVVGPEDWESLNTGQRGRPQSYVQMSWWWWFTGLVVGRRVSSRGVQVPSCMSQSGKPTHDGSSCYDYCGRASEVRRGTDGCFSWATHYWPASRFECVKSPSLTPVWSYCSTQAPRSAAGVPSSIRKQTDEVSRAETIGGAKTIICQVQVEILAGYHPKGPRWGEGER